MPPTAPAIMLPREVRAGAPLPLERRLDQEARDPEVLARRPEVTAAKRLLRLPNHLLHIVDEDEAEVAKGRDLGLRFREPCLQAIPQLPLPPDRLVDVLDARGSENEVPRLHRRPPPGKGGLGVGGRQALLAHGLDRLRGTGQIVELPPVRLADADRLLLGLRKEVFPLLEVP